MTVDDLIDEAFDFLRAHPNATEDRVKDYLMDVAMGRVGSRKEDIHQRLFWLGPVVVAIQEMFRSTRESSHAPKIEKALRVVFRDQRKKKARRERDDYEDE